MITSALAAQEKYMLECDSRLLEASLDTAIAQAGTSELTDNNDGPVEKYLEAAGLMAGYPYCAAGQYYCFRSAADAFNMNHKEIPILRTGVANAIFNHAKNKKRSAKYIPAKHDLIVWRHQGKFSGHIERIIEAGKAGWVKTIAFNVSKRINGKRVEGVFIKKRNVYHPLGRMLLRGLVGFIEKEAANDG